MAPAFIGNGKIHNTLNYVMPTNDSVAVAIVFGNRDIAVVVVYVGTFVACVRIVAYSVGSGIFAAVIVFVGGAVACMCIAISAGSSVFGKMR